MDFASVMVTFGIFSDANVSHDCCARAVAHSTSRAIGTRKADRYARRIIFHPRFGHLDVSRRFLRSAFGPDATSRNSTSCVDWARIIHPLFEQRAGKFGDPKDGLSRLTLIGKMQAKAPPWKSAREDGARRGPDAPVERIERNRRGGNQCDQKSSPVLHRADHHQEVQRAISSVMISAAGRVGWRVRIPFEPARLRPLPKTR